MIELRADRPKFGQVTIQPPDFSDCNHGFRVPISPASPAHGIDSAPASVSRFPMRPLPPPVYTSPLPACSSDGHSCRRRRRAGRSPAMTVPALLWLVVAKMILGHSKTHGSRRS